MKATTLTVLVIIMTDAWSSGCEVDSSRSLSARADQTKAPDAITDAEDDRSAPPPNLMVIGASSLLPPLDSSPNYCGPCSAAKGFKCTSKGGGLRSTH